MHTRIVGALTLCTLLGTAASAPALAPPSLNETASAETASPEQKKTAVPNTPNDPVHMARELWKLGVQAFQKKDYAAARSAFERCYAFMPKTEVLRNLSISEVESGAYVAAARHLTLLLTPESDLSQEVRARLATLLERSLAQVGQLAIRVKKPGRPIWVDGTNVGESPLDSTWYVSPGRHTVRIENPEGPDTARRVYALAGVSIPVQFKLVADSSPTPDTVPNTVPEKAFSPASTRAVFAQSAPPRLDLSDQLTTRATVTVATGGALAALSLAGATYFTANAYRHSALAESISLELQSGPGTAPTTCSNNTPFTSECAQLLRHRSAQRANLNRAKASFVGFGIAGTATLGYALYLALRSPHAPSANLSPMLDIRKTGTSLGLMGRF